MKKRRAFDGPLFPRDEAVHQGYEMLALNEYENMQKKHLKAYLKGDKFFFYKGRKYEVGETWEYA
jgi:hypothetical protein